MAGDPGPRELSQPWLPSRRLRDQLYFGAIAVIISSGLAAVGIAVTVTQGVRSGWSISRPFALATILPLALVLTVYRQLADELGDARLKRAAVSAVVSGWLIQVWQLFGYGQLFPEGSSLRAAWYIVTITFLLLAAYTWPRLAWLFWTLAAAFLVLCLAPGVVRPEWLRWSFWFMLAWLPISLLGFGIWFGVTLITLRDRLGRVATTCGWMYALPTLMFSTALAWVLSGALENVPRLVGYAVLYLPLIALAQISLLTLPTERLFKELCKRVLSRPQLAESEGTFLRIGIRWTWRSPPDSVVPTTPPASATSKCRCPECGGEAQKQDDYCKQCGTVYWEPVANGFKGVVVLVTFGGLGLWWFQNVIGWLGSGAVLGTGVLALGGLIFRLREASRCAQMWQQRDQDPRN